MKIALSALLAAAILAPTAFANTYVKCGQSVDPDTFEVSGYELELSSEGADDYSGPVGKNWNMKLGSESSSWLKPNKNITAKSYRSGRDTIVEITIKKGRSATGIVGEMYKLIGLFSDSPVLEKYTVGGLAGSTRIGMFECISGND